MKLHDNANFLQVHSCTVIYVFPTEKIVAYVIQILSFLYLESFEF